MWTVQRFKLAHAAQLCRLSSRAASHETWEFSISDLPDYFHNLSAPGEHILHSAEGRPYSAKELRDGGIEVDVNIDNTTSCMCCSTTIVMGDKKAVPIAQVAHYQMLLDGKCTAPMLEYGKPIPGGDLAAGVVVDDYATFKRNVPSEAVGGSGRELDLGLAGYTLHGTAPKASKLHKDRPAGKVWGGNFDGGNNRVAESTDKIFELVFILLAALQCGCLAPSAMQILTGGWGFCMMFRRATYSLFHYVYNFARMPDPDAPRRIDGASRAELFISALTAPLMCSHLDWEYGQKLYSHDACGTGGCAFGFADVTSASLEEMWRFAGCKEVSNSQDASEAARQPWPDPAECGEDQYDQVDPKKHQAPFISEVPKPFRNISDQKLVLLQSWISKGQGLFLELWCGTAGLTRAITALGFECLGGVDVCHPEAEDLLDLGFVELLLKVVRARIFRLVHMGVVCTTFSIAARPAYRYRDDEGWTCTFGGLPEHKRAKAAIGDRFVHLAVAISEIQLDGGNSISIENPGSSLFWSVRAVYALMKRWNLFLFAWDMCQFGAPFKKFTKLLTDIAELCKLVRRCCRTHIHEVLSGATYDEASGKWQSRTKLAQEYPPALCEAYARIVTSCMTFVPKGVLSSQHDDSHRISDFSPLHEQTHQLFIAARDRPGAPVSPGTPHF